MRILSLTRYALTILGLILLGACGSNAVQPPVGLLRQPTDAVAQPSQEGRSWMSPDAKNHDLLYATYFGGEIYVFDYPNGKLEGALTGDISPQGECVDRQGNVWITDSSAWQLLEYAHGGTSPIAILSKDISEPYDCAVDPTTGDITVINSTKLIAVFRHGRGAPTQYYVPGSPLWATYDDKGNLFIDGLNVQHTFQLFELAKGSNAVAEISLSNVVSPGDIKWDGKVLAIGDLYQHLIDQVQVTESGAKIVGSTAGVPQYYFCFPNAESEKAGQQAGKIIATGGGGIGEWSYPAGGSPLKYFEGAKYPSGLAISPGKN
jgi:hypothetical protein